MRLNFLVKEYIFAHNIILGKKLNLIAMKNLRLLSQLLIIVLTLSLFSCNDSDSDNNVSEVIISKESLSFSFAGGEDIIYIQADKSTKVTSDSEWCIVTEENYSSDKTRKFLVSVAPNNALSERKASISVATNNDVKTVDVVQAGELQTENDNIIVKALSSGGDYTLDIVANKQLSISINGETWINAQFTKIDNGYTLKADFKANKRSEQRSGMITLSSDDKNIEISVLQEGVDEATGMNLNSKDLAKEIYLGWNLGNTLEAVGKQGDIYVGGEVSWGNPYTTQEMIKAIKNAGFNSVRIPVSWDVYSVNKDTHEISEEWMARVREVVDYVVDNDMYAMINIHWDGGWLENNCNPDKKAVNIVKQRAYWTQIANEFKHYDEHLLFAGCNEPEVRNATQMDVLFEYEQTFIDAVRATGGRNAKRNLIVQGPVTDIYLTLDLMKMPIDNIPDRLMIEVHYYEPWTFCGLTEDVSWGKMAYLWGKAFSSLATGELSGRWTADCDEQHMHSQFRKMKEKYVDNGIPVILGEFGVTYRKLSDKTAQESHDKSRAYYYEYITEQAKNYGLVPYVWDNGGDMGVFNRHTLTTNNLMESMLKGASAGIYPY